LVFGRNSITVYVFAWLFAELLSLLEISLNNTRLNGHDYIFQRFFAPLGSPSFTSLLFSLAYVLVCLIPIWLMDRKKIFLKI
jgi:predicted acyltransferase